MAFLHFKKEHLSDLSFSLTREYLLTNRKGTYCSSSLANCNTRKYHGLFVVSQPQIDDNRYVLLSSLDETITRGEKKVQLGTHRYPYVYSPQGYKFLGEFTYERTPQWMIEYEDIRINKEILLVRDENRLLLRYTVIQCDTPFELRFDPFVAYRNIHSLSKANLNVNKKSEKITNGVKLKMYAGFESLYMQLSRKGDFIQAPDWYYNTEYTREQERGYDYSEDLYTPGYLKLKVKQGDQIIFSAGTSEISPRKLSNLFERELKAHKPLTNFKECLENAAEQFIVTNGTSEIMAGYHWFGPWGRDTFIALPGLTLSTGKPEICKAILDSNLKQLKKNGLFPNVGQGELASYNSADASLWFFWALQQYIYSTGSIALAWEEYGSKMKSILSNYRKGTLHNIHMEDNGLLYTGEHGTAVTWMDAVVNGKPVTPRIGFAVELNALWYNAIRFALECAEHDGDKKFISDWSTLPVQIELAFNETFWNDEKGYLADCVNGAHHDWSIRPNQVIAASLPFSPVNDEIKRALLDVVQSNLLTPRGLRTLAPDDENYEGVYHGTQHTRDLAYHQGTVWPWLLGHFTEAYLKIFGEAGKELLQLIYENFAPALLEYGIGTIAEIYDGNDPYAAKGAISQAWSISELLRMRELIITYSHKAEALKKLQAVETI